MKRIAGIALSLALLVSVASAQEGGTLKGTVHTGQKKLPVSGAMVILANTTFAAVTDDKGSYVIAELPAGHYDLHISSPGFDDAVQQVELSPGQTVQVSTPLAKTYVGQEVVVTGSKFPEKRLDAPVTVERLSQDDIAMSGGSNVGAALANVKGVDYADTGVGQKRISMRGFNTMFNSRMLTMVDGRLAQLPGSGLPMGELMPTPSLDVRSIEIVEGPASALYGPNAHTGVVNVLTKTPWDEAGASVLLRGGTQNMADVTARVAGTAAHDFGYKVNAEYMRAEDFEPNRNSPQFYYGSPGKPLLFEGDLLSGNYDLSAAKAEAFLYYRRGDWNLKGGYGFSLSDGLTATNAGRNDLRGWQVHYQTLELSHPHWYAQVTRTATDAGDSYQIDRLASTVQAMGGIPSDPAQLEALRQKLRFIDSSQLVDGEVQWHDEFRHLRLTSGVQSRVYLPSSQGSYLDDAGGKSISATEVGGYAQAEYPILADRLRAVAAARVDAHTDYDTQFSPKAALVYTVAPGHNLRAGYNRAFKTPTILENYLLIGGSFVGNRSGFDIRDAAGNLMSKIAPLAPEQVNAAEVGYKGSFGEKLFVDVVGYYSFYDNFISPLTQRSNPAMGSFAFYPDGRPVAQGTPLEGTLFTYSNFGQAEVVGGDAGLDWMILPKLTVAGSVSYIHLVDFTNHDPTQKSLLLNVPDLKGRLTVTLQNLGLRDSFVRLTGRVQQSYPFASGRWVSSAFFADGEIPARMVADVTVGKTFADGFTVSASVFNLLDDHGIDILGAPPGGILGYVTLTYNYRGLER